MKLRLKPKNKWHDRIEHKKCHFYRAQKQNKATILGRNGINQQLEESSTY